jgi:hypothetical protein
MVIRHRRTDATHVNRQMRGGLEETRDIAYIRLSLTIASGRVGI